MTENSTPEKHPAEEPFSVPFKVIYQHHVIISLFNRKKDVVSTNMTEEELINKVVKPYNNESKFGIEDEVLLPDEIKQIKITKSANCICEESYGDLWNSVNSAENVTERFINKQVGASGLKKGEASYQNKLKSSHTSKVSVIDLFNSMVTHAQIKEASINHFKNGEYRSAVLDAAITLEEMVKQKAKVPKDNSGKELSGYRLMHAVFDVNKPILSWCKNERQIERDELEGYKLIFAGTVQGIRDPKAHAVFQIEPERALKLLTLVTLLAELVDASELIAQKAEPVVAQPNIAAIAKKAITSANEDNR